MLVIQAPSGTQLEVPSVVGEGVRDSTVVYGAPRQSKKKYQMHLKSRSGQISVFLINQETAEKTALHSNQIAVNGASSIDGPFNGEADQVASAKHSNNKITTRREGSPVKESSNKSPNPSSTVNATSTPDTAPVPAIRTLSPRKAAQNHLIVRSKRDGSAPTQILSVGSPPKRKVSTGKAPVVENIETPSVERVVSPNEDTVDENKAINNKLEGGIIKRPRRMSEILGLLDGDIIPDVEQPLIRLSPPPNARDYRFNLDESEGAGDLFEP